MNTMAIVSELADSGIIGDHDAHVVAYEEWLFALDQECRCCCCTGECREYDDDDDPLMSGFVEGDYEAA